MSKQVYTIRNARPDEFEAIGELMVEAYSSLEGFPKPADLPEYYDLLRNVGRVTGKPGAELLVAVSPEDHLAGAVVYFGDVTYYGADDIVTQQKNAAGFRLLAVSKQARGEGLGRLLTMECIRKAREQKREQLIIHTTQAMQTAWQMYERIGFRRSADLDFERSSLEVFGFRLPLG